MWMFQFIHTIVELQSEIFQRLWKEKKFIFDCSMVKIHFYILLCRFSSEPPFFGVCELVPRLRVLADQTMMLIIRKLFRVTFFWKS